MERTQPGFLAGERLRKVLFGAHPYAQVSPSEDQVAAYRREDLQAVYREFYTPENALLVMVGDFDSAAMMATIDSIFGGWTGKKPASKPAAEPANPRGRHVYLVDVPAAVQTQIMVGCHAIYLLGSVLPSTRKKFTRQGTLASKFAVIAFMGIASSAAHVLRFSSKLTDRVNPLLRSPRPEGVISRSIHMPFGAISNSL